MAKEKRPMKKLAAMRKSAGLTQGDLAYMCGVRLSTISDYERGVRLPYAPMMSKLAKCCGCSLDDIDEWKSEA